MRIVDLTLTLGPDVTPVPNHPRVAFAPVTTLERDGVNNTQVSFSIHTGTHVDAPLHFVAGGRTIDQIPLDTFIGKAFLVDLRRYGLDRHGYTVAELAAAGLPAPDRLRGNRVVLWSGWAQQRWNNALYPSDPHLSEEAVRHLVSAGVAAIAMDHGIDGGPPWFGHKHALGHGVPLVENLVNLDKIGQSEFTLVVMPLKIQNGNGGPARVAALIND